MIPLASLAAGNKALVFDPRIWGGKDKGNNEHCWQVGTLFNVTGVGRHQKADVQWPDGSITLRHFVSAMRPLPLASLAGRSATT